MYHPQTQGQVENNNKWMEMYLQMFCLHQQDDWVDLLPMAEFAYNNHHHPLIDTTPFFANYGYHPTLMNVPNARQSGKPDEWICWIHETQEECKHTIEWLQEISKQGYNKWKNKNPGWLGGSLDPTTSTCKLGLASLASHPCVEIDSPWLDGDIQGL